MTVTDKHRIPASALSISVGAYGSVTEIAFSIRSATGTAPAEAIPIKPGACSAITDAGSTENGAGPAAAGTGLSQTCAEPAENSNKRRKPLHLLLLRHDMMFRLIKIIAASHGGSATWKKTRRSLHTVTVAYRISSDDRHQQVTAGAGRHTRHGS